MYSHAGKATLGKSHQYEAQTRARKKEREKAQTDDGIPENILSVFVTELQLAVLEMLVYFEKLNSNHILLVMSPAEMDDGTFIPGRHLYVVSETGFKSKWA